MKATAMKNLSATVTSGAAVLTDAMLHAAADLADAGQRVDLRIREDQLASLERRLPQIHGRIFRINR